MEAIMDITQDIQSLTNFRNHSAVFIKRMKKTKSPLVLTVKGKAAVVVQDAESYQRLLDIAAAGSVEEGIQQGLEDVKHGRTRSAEAFFKEFRAKHGIPG
jgi:prevent-host-death family protein